MAGYFKFFGYSITNSSLNNPFIQIDRSGFNNRSIADCMLNIGVVTQTNKKDIRNEADRWISSLEMTTGSKFEVFKKIAQ